MDYKVYHPSKGPERCVGPIGTAFFENHAHECPNCGLIWTHDPLRMHGCTVEQFDAAHTCPTCGAEQTMTYSGHNRPKFEHDGSGTLKSLAGCRFKFLPDDIEAMRARGKGNPLYCRRRESIEQESEEIQDEEAFKRFVGLLETLLSQAEQSR